MASACNSITSRTLGYADSGGGVGMSAIRSAAARSRIARLNGPHDRRAKVRLTAALRKVLPHGIIRDTRRRQRVVAQLGDLVRDRLERAAGDSPNRHAQVSQENAARGVDGPRPAVAVAPLGHSSTDTIDPDQRPDHHVLDPDQADLPPGRSDQIEGDQHPHREGGLGRGERRDFGHIGRAEHDDRHQHPQHHRVDTQNADDRRAEQEPDARADHGPHHLVPVVNALLRSTDIAPSTTQNPCSTGNRCVTATASANPRPVRRLLRTATERLAKNPT